MQIRELELLRLANNRLVSIPDWLLAFPLSRGLPLQATLASPPPRSSSLGTVKFGELELGAKLGEGTSSIVRKATLTHDRRGSSQGAALSDGKNLDEVRRRAPWTIEVSLAGISRERTQRRGGSSERCGGGVAAGGCAQWARLLLLSATLHGHHHT